MARLIGPDEASRLVYTSAGLAKAQGYTGTVYTDAGGTVLASILTLAGAAISGSQVTVDAYSRLPLFQFPDGLDTVYITVKGGPLVAVYARTDDRLDAALPKTGGTIAGPLAVNKVGGSTTVPLGIVRTSGRGAADNGVNILSSFAGGEDDGSPGSFDSTGRSNWYSFQRADYGCYGETNRHFLMRANAKAMIAWYAARQNGAMTHGYDGNGDPDPDADWRPVAWAGAHWEANNGGDPHGHWSVEVPDSTGAVQTRFEVPFTDQSLPAASRQFGVDVTNIATNLADLTVRATNGQVLRIGGGNTHKKDIVFAVGSTRSTVDRRWSIRVDNDTEAGSDAGSTWQLVPHTDGGTEKTAAIRVVRSTGNVDIGTSTVGRLTVGSATLNPRKMYVEDTAATNNAFMVKATVTGTATSAIFAIESSATGKRVFDYRVTNDAVSRLRLDTSAGAGSGTLTFGDGATADTNLYRSAAATLATDNSFTVGATLRHLGTSAGFYGAAAVTKPSITGSRGGNAALASLLTSLATLGLITDSTTA